RAVDRARRLERGRDVLAPIVVVRTGFPLLALEPTERDPDPVDGHLDVVRREQVRRRELRALGRQLHFAVLHLVLPILAMGSLLAEDATQPPVDRTAQPSRGHRNEDWLVAVVRRVRLIAERLAAAKRERSGIGSHRERARARAHHALAGVLRIVLAVRVVGRAARAPRWGAAPPADPPVPARRIPPPGPRHR